MYSVKQLGITLFTIIALAATATGQTLTVTPGPLSVGQEASIQYSNPSRAGEEITVEIHDGAGNPPAKVKIQLDENGEGSGTWTVPNWDVAIFEAPEATAEARPIE